MLVMLDHLHIVFKTKSRLTYGPELRLTCEKIDVKSNNEYHQVIYPPGSWTHLIHMVTVTTAVDKRLSKCLKDKLSHSFILPQAVV